MTLLLAPTAKSTPLANYYKNNKLSSIISYKDVQQNEDDEVKPLTKIRLNAEDERFFININDFKETNQRQAVYLCGMSGVGKTTTIIQYIKEFHAKYPKARILLFSSKSHDANLDTMSYVERIKITEDMLVNQMTLAEISARSKPVLTVWDDVEDFSTPKLTKEIERLLNEVLRNGRSYGIYAIYSHHQPCDYIRTRNLLFEATHVIIYPRRSGKEAYNYLMEKKLNLNKKTIEIINKTFSNYVCIKKSVPQVVISDKYILLV